MDDASQKEDPKIQFTDFIVPPDPTRTKVKFNVNPNDPSLPAWDLLLDDSDRWLGMNEWRSKKSSNHNLDKADYLIALAQYYPYGPNYYIFGGMYRVNKTEPEINNGRGYRLELMDDYSEYRKRLIIKLQEPIGRNVYNRRYDMLQTSPLNPEIYELAPATKLGAFPGYNRVTLKHKDLERIIEIEEANWKQALSNVKAVYVITDRHTGKLYIGSASGNDRGLWQRWAAYADLNNLTGGNQKLQQLKAEKGSQYIIDNFQYSILEIFDTKTKIEDIISRESYWKRVLATREHGLNDN